MTGQRLRSKHDLDGGPRDPRYLWARWAQLHGAENLPGGLAKLPHDLGHRDYIPRHRLAGNITNADRPTVPIRCKPSPHPRTGHDYRDLDIRGAVISYATDIDPQPCEWCQENGAVTTVRVYGQPDEDDPHGPQNPIDITEACRPCAPAVIRQAITEQAVSDDNDIRVEVQKQ